MFYNTPYTSELIEDLVDERFLFYEEKKDYNISHMTISSPSESDEDEVNNDMDSKESLLSPITSPMISKEDDIEPLRVFNRQEYHMGFVELYKDAILRQTDPHCVSPKVLQSIETTLPHFYKQYLQCIKKSSDAL